MHGPGYAWAPCMGYLCALRLHLLRWLPRLWFCALGFGSMLPFRSSSLVLVQGFRFGPVLQFWLMLRFWALALVPALVLAVAFGFGPLFQLWPLFAFAVRGGSKGGTRAQLRSRAPGVAQRLWFDDGRGAPLHSLRPLWRAGLASF